MITAKERIPAVVWDVIRKDAQCAIMYLCSAASTSFVDPALIPLNTIALHNNTTQKEPEELSLAQRKHQEWKLVYDVMRVQHHSILFENSHVERIVSSYTETSKRLLSDKAIERLRSLLRTYAADDTVRLPDHDEQNIKFITWVVTPNAEVNADMNEDVFFVLYFIASFFPPLSWYSHGTELALLYHASRTNPHAKVIQSTLRSRAKALQDSAHVFEVLLVHDEDDEYVIPEGSRSNYLLFTHDDRILCSSINDILIGITLSSALQAIKDAKLGDVEHRRLNFRDICAARSFVMLGTSVGTLPVKELVLYTDAESKRDFTQMVDNLKIDMEQIHNYKPIPPTNSSSSEASKAILEFDVDNSTLRKLKHAYDSAAYAAEERYSTIKKEFDYV